MAMGQAAGTAVARAMAENLDVRNLDPTRLRADLTAAGVILD